MSFSANDDLSKKQYLEVSSMVKAEFSKAEEKFDTFQNIQFLFMQDIRKDLALFKKESVERIEVLEAIIFKSKVWVYTAGTIIIGILSSLVYWFKTVMIGLKLLIHQN